jgi:2,2-dialkylglycine decarboxylase (pyruvate)
VGQNAATCGGACLDASLAMLGDQIHNIAAVIVEPIVSAGGMIYPPTSYFERLRDITRSHGVLFIVDEAQTGFGRCGRWFDIQNHGIEPDIMVVSKTAGNGYPVAAVIVSDDVARKLEARFFMHLSSHQNDPLAAAAVLGVIEAVEAEDLVAHSREMGERFVSGLRALQARHPQIVDVRGRGLMIGVELAPGADDNGATAFKAALLCEQRGVHLTFSYYEPVLRIIPPLVITPREIDFALSVLDDALGALARGVDVMDLVPRNVRSGPFVRSMMRTTPTAFVKKLWNTSPHQWLRKIRSMR